MNNADIIASVMPMMDLQRQMLMDNQLMMNAYLSSGLPGYTPPYRTEGGHASPQVIIVGDVPIDGRTHEQKRHLGDVNSYEINRTGLPNNHVDDIHVYPFSYERKDEKGIYVRIEMEEVIAYKFASISCFVRDDSRDEMKLAQSAFFEVLDNLDNSITTLIARLTATCQPQFSDFLKSVGFRYDEANDYFIMGTETQED